MRRVVIIGLLVAACGKGKDAAPGAGSAATGSAAAPAGDARAAIIEAWRTGGLQPSAFTPAAASAMGKACTSGTVSGVDVTLCLFANPGEAKAAEEPGLAWVGEFTGAAQARGSVLIAIADRRKADPSGRTINQLLKLAPK
jgi:hypothetical protein